MNCIFSSPLTDEQISFLLDGNTDEELESHLEQCPACRQRFEEAGQIELMLKKKLFRGDCPSPQMLTDFHMGLLDQTNQQNNKKNRESPENLCNLPRRITNIARLYGYR